MLAAGQPLTEGVVATHVLALTQEVIKTMFLTKLKLGTAAVLCAGLFAALIGGSFTSLGIAQEAKPQEAFQGHSGRVLWEKKAESDADFIRRISKDLRGTDPTPTEIHFFVTSKDAGRRQKLIDLFIQERQAKMAAQMNQFSFKSDESLSMKWKADPQNIVKQTMAFSPDFKHMEVDIGGNKIRFNLQQVDDNWLALKPTPGLGTLQQEFYKQLHAAEDKGDVAKISQAYLDRLVDFVKTNPKSQDVPGAMEQIILMYQSQGKVVDADAWRAKLLKEQEYGPRPRQ